MGWGERTQPQELPFELSSLEPSDSSDPAQRGQPLLLDAVGFIMGLFMNMKIDFFSLFLFLIQSLKT